MITFISEPQFTMPSDNPIIWILESDLPDLAYIKIDVRHPVTSEVYGVIKAYPTPDNPQRVYVNLSAIMDAVVKYTFTSYDTELVSELTANIQRYALRLQEFIVLAGSIVPGPDGFDFSSTKRNFKSHLDKITWSNFSDSDYTLTALTTPGAPVHFLTTKPSRTIVNMASEEALYFMRGDLANMFIRLTFYDFSGGVLHEQNISNPGAFSVHSVFKVNVSPAFLASAIPTLNFDLVDYFTVLLTDSTDVLSDTRIYKMENPECGYSPVNVFFVNKFGGVDSIEMLNPESSVDTDKVSIKKNDLLINESGLLSYYDNGIFNVVDQIISTNVSQKIKLKTRILSDEETTWLSGIFESPQIFMKIASNLYVPLTLADTGMALTPARYLQTTANIKELTFQLSEGFIPDFKL